MKKTLAFLLAAILLLSLVACGGQTAEEPTAPAEETAQTEESEYHGELPFVKEGEEPVTITIGIVTSGLVTDYKENAYTKWLEEQTGLNLEFVQFADSKSAATQVALMISANEKLPDILFRTGSISKQQGEEYGQEGYFAPLTDYFENYAYYFRQSYDELYHGDPTQLELTLHRCAGADNQPIYCFPFVLRDQWSDAELQGWINQDWLDKLGLKAPETVDELYDVLVAFRDQDPNGNGVKDEIPMVGKTLYTYQATEPLNWIINAYTYFDNHTHFVANDRKISAPYDSDEYREALKFINKLFKEGLITEISWTQTEKELKGLINPAPGDPCLCGIVFYYGTSIFTENSDSLYAYNPLKPLKAETPKGGYAANYYDRVMTTYISADCERPDLAFKLLDFTCSSEAYLRQRYGEFGVDWTWAEPGKPGHRGGEAKIKLLNPLAYSQQNAQCWHVVATVGSELDWQYEIDELDEWNALRVQKLNELYENSVVNARIPDEVFDFAIYSRSDYEERSEFANDIRDYVFNCRSEFCTGVTDPNSDSDWQTYLDGLKALHYDRWIELAQIGYDRLFE